MGFLSHITHAITSPIKAIFGGSGPKKVAVQTQTTPLTKVTVPLNLGVSVPVSAYLDTEGVEQAILQAEGLKARTTQTALAQLGQILNTTTGKLTATAFLIALFYFARKR